MMGDCLEIFQTISKKCPKVQLFQYEKFFLSISNLYFSRSDKHFRRGHESGTFTAPSMVREPSLSIFIIHVVLLSLESCETGTVHKQKHPSHKILKKKT